MNSKLKISELFFFFFFPRKAKAGTKEFLAYS